MNLQESINHLRKIGWHVSKEGEKYRAHRVGYKKYCSSPKYNFPDDMWKDFDLYSPRKLIQLAKSFSSENNQSTAIKKRVKSNQKTKTRRKTRDTLLSCDEDKIDNLADEKLDDAWNYS